MSDDLESQLRTLLRSRAGSITTEDERILPAWTPPGRPRRWWPPALAAAVVVMAVVGLAVGLKAFGPAESGSGGGAQGEMVTLPSPTPHAVAGLPTVPAGKRAVNTLGVEVFVPSSWRPFHGCSGQIGTPLTALTNFPPYSCPTTNSEREPQITIDRAVTRSQIGCATGLPEIIVGGTSHCVGRSANSLVLQVDDRGVTVISVQSASDTTSLQILKTVHLVDGDRLGCSTVPDAASERNSTPVGATGYRTCAYLGSAGRSSEILMGSAVVSGESPIGDLLGGGIPGPSRKNRCPAGSTLYRFEITPYLIQRPGQRFTATSGFCSAGVEVAGNSEHPKHLSTGDSQRLLRALLPT